MPLRYEDFLKVSLNAPAGSALDLLVRQKHEAYARQAKWNAVFYYALRLIAGVCAVLLPFVVSSDPKVASGLSIALALVTVVDLIFNPKFQWQLYSEATNLITIEILKQSGEYAANKPLFDLVLKTERARLSHLEDLKSLLDQLQKHK